MPPTSGRAIAFSVDLLIFIGFIDRSLVAARIGSHFAWRPTEGRSVPGTRPWLEPLRPTLGPFPPMKKRLLGERLIKAGLVKEQQLTHALKAQQATGEQLGTLLVRLGYLREVELLQFLCEDAGIQFSTLDDVVTEPAAVALVPESLARSADLLPIAVADGRLTVALADPFNVTTLTSLERAVGRRVSVIGAPRPRIRAMLEQAYNNGAAPGRAPREARPEPPSAVVATEAPEEGIEGSPTTTRLADDLLNTGVALGATDIHVEPTAAGVDVRYRIDGVLRPGATLPRSVQAPLLTRLKIMASLNIAESRLPQDGRMRIRSANRDVDLRISTFPTLHGEDLVLRVLDRERVALRLDGLGFDDADLALFRDILHRPHGLVLITGPTGSGKTTTLYSALAEMNLGERCVLTLEDPIEYELEGIRQAQVNPRAGLTFASGLRSLLRHDPDVIFVGEMRDHETAEIGLRAAMTGHLVLSTLHTNTAAGAIPRLLDMGLEPFALTSSLQLCMAQRLVRQLCVRCRRPTDVPAAVRRRFGLETTELFTATGCPACNQTGYKGRMAIYELLPIDEEIAGAVYDRLSAEEIQRRSGRPSLLAAGLNKVRAGRTSLEELLRIVSL
jgi:type IV pilus assembly protein PilB